MIQLLWPDRPEILSVQYTLCCSKTLGKMKNCYLLEFRVIHPEISEIIVINYLVIKGTDSIIKQPQWFNNSTSSELSTGCTTSPKKSRAKMGTVFFVKQNTSVFC